MKKIKFIIDFVLTMPVLAILIAYWIHQHGKEMTLNYLVSMVLHSDSTENAEMYKSVNQLKFIFWGLAVFLFILGKTFIR